MPKRLTFIIVALLLASSLVMAQRRNPDGELLGRALEYFTSQKYHESLLIFERLDKEYDLNDRFKAYIGLCYFYEWDYKKAAAYLDKVIPRLDMLSPHELSVYCYSDGESHFLLKDYDGAIPLYEQALKLCYERERGDILYRLGLCYMFKEQWQRAVDRYRGAIGIYRRYHASQAIDSRLAQALNMMRGCQAKIDARRRADSLRLAAAVADSLQMAEYARIDSMAQHVPSFDSLLLAADTSLFHTPMMGADTAAVLQPPVIATDTTATDTLVMPQPAIDESSQKPLPPTDDHPQRRQQEQPDVAPVNLDDLYNDKIDINEK